MQEYSFLISIYKNTRVDEMKVCMDSMVGQTFLPEQIVIVIDGPIPDDLTAYIEELKEKYLDIMTIVPIAVNGGLGNALKEGMKYCRNELVARLDSDDYSSLDRCEKEVKFMEDHSEVDVVGSNMPEFIGIIDNIVAKRVVPRTHEEICAYLKKRCPFNHISVMFRKEAVEKAGGYLDWHYNEDSYLWVRMYLAGSRFYNIQEDLSFARVGKDMYRRRGGWKYYKSERDLFKYMRKNKIIGWGGYLIAKYERLILQVLMPNCMRQWVFKKFARS